MIEELLKAQIDALNRNTEALNKAAGSAAAPATGGKGKTTASTDAKVTQEQVNAALIKIKDAHGMDEAKSIIKEHGKVDKMADIKPANYQAVYDAALKKFDELAAKDDGM